MISFSLLLGFSIISFSGKSLYMHVYDASLKIHHSSHGLTLTARDNEKLAKSCVACTDKFVKSCQELKPALKAIAGKKSLTFPNGETLTCESVDTSDPDYVTYIYTGSNSSESYITFSTSGKETVIGDLLASNGDFFKFESCGKHIIWMTLDTKNMSKSHDTTIEFDALDRQSSFIGNMALNQDKAKQEELLKKGLTSDEIAEVSLKVYYTDEYERDVEGKPAEAIAGLIAYANKGFENSGIKIKYILHCIEKYVGRENPNQMPFWNFMQHKGTGEKLLASADMAQLLTKNSNGGILGAAATSTKYPYGWTSNVGDVWNTFAHEAGHNFGAGHDPRTLQQYGSSPTKEYGRGFLLPNTNKHTTMAYSQGTWNKPINYFSSATVKDADGAATGSALNDNARLLNNVRFLMAANGDESEACSINTNTPAPPPSSPSSLTLTAKDNPNLSDECPACDEGDVIKCQELETTVEELERVDDVTFPTGDKLTYFATSNSDPNYTWYLYVGEGSRSYMAFSKAHSYLAYGVLETSNGDYFKFFSCGGKIVWITL